jgi:hypothetical protein
MLKIYGSDLDPTAIHTNIPGEINSIELDIVDPTNALFVVEDSSIGYPKRKLHATAVSLPNSDTEAIHKNRANEFSMVDEKFPVHPSDRILIEDSEDLLPGAKKYSTIAGITIDVIGDGTTFKKMLLSERSRTFFSK